MSGGICRKLTDKTVKAFVAQSERGKKLADGGGLICAVKNGVHRFKQQANLHSTAA